MQITYQSAKYSPEAVTDRFVCSEGEGFRVFECGSVGGSGRFTTLREYVTAGEEVPVAVRERAADSEVIEPWR